MKLVLDSNIICQDYRLTSTNFRVLREGLHIIPATLTVPEVVIDEVVNRFREDLEESLVAAEKAGASLSRLLPGVPLSPFEDTDPVKESAAYREWLLSALGELGVEILPYPDIPHKKVVERDLQRKRPFKRNGSGYRDYLIWESVRRLALWGTEHIVFVTGNTTDFGVGPLVTADLQKDILNPDRLELTSSLKGFNDKFVIPRLEMVEEMKAKLLSEIGGYFDVARWLHNNILDLLRDQELGSVILGFPEGAGSVWPSEVDAFEYIAVDDVRKLSENEILVHVVVEVDVEFSVDIDWDDYTRYPEIRDWAGEDSEPFLSLSSQHRDNLELCINLVLDTKGEQLISYEVGSIGGAYGSVDMT